MSAIGLPLFSADALAILDRMPFDPEARSIFDLMSGGLVWADEFPCIGSPEWAVVKPNWVYRYAVAYRASLTVGPERAEFRAVWEQINQHAPNWPGLRLERRGDRARHRLLAGMRREAVCLRGLDDEMNAKDNQSKLP